MENDEATMPGTSPPRVSALLNAMFPRMPDFHGLLNDQCDLVVRAMDEFVAFLETGDRALRWPAFLGFSSLSAGVFSGMISYEYL